MSGLRAATLIVGARVVVWITVQLAIAAIIATTSDESSPINAAAAWWMVYGSAADVVTLGLVVWLVRREGSTWRDLIGPSMPLWQVAAGALAVLVASVPAVLWSANLNTAFYGDVTPPMLAVIDVPQVASAYSVLVWPILAELAEPVAFLGYLLPRLERETRSRWIAATIVVALWGLEHASLPLLMTDGAVDVTFAAYRVISVLPFLAIWTALYYAFGRRLLPIMVARWIFNGGTAFAVAMGFVA